MIGSATLEVLPDTSIVVRPAETTVPAGGNRSFTASVYNLRNGSLIQDHAPIDWRVPAYPPALSRFAIGSVSADSLGDNATLAVANDAASGVTAPLRAQIGDGPFQQGGARVTIGTDTTSNDPTPSPQGCGPGNPAVATIQIQNGTDITIDRFGGMHQIEAVARNGSGNVVSTPELRYTTADENVALVDQNGQITATGTAGTTTITVCSGDFAAAAITVRVQ
jgi:hypothetical protein